MTHDSHCWEVQFSGRCGRVKAYHAGYVSCNRGTQETRKSSVLSSVLYLEGMNKWRINKEFKWSREESEEIYMSFACPKGVKFLYMYKKFNLHNKAQQLILILLMSMHRWEKWCRYFSHTAGKRSSWDSNQDLIILFLMLYTLWCQKATFVSSHCNWKSSLPSKTESDKTLLCFLRARLSVLGLILLLN